MNLPFRIVVFRDFSTFLRMKWAFLVNLKLRFKKCCSSVHFYAISWFDNYSTRYCQRKVNLVKRRQLCNLYSKEFQFSKIIRDRMEDFRARFSKTKKERRFSFASRVPRNFDFPPSVHDVRKFKYRISVLLNFSSFHQTPTPSDA